jgi:hypothetical protein
MSDSISEHLLNLAEYDLDALRDENARLEDENEQLKSALRPFAALDLGGNISFKAWDKSHRQWLFFNFGADVFKVAAELSKDEEEQANQ